MRMGDHEIVYPDNKPQRFRWSLRIALAGALCGVVVLATLMVAATNYMVTSRFARERLRERLAHAVAIAVLSVPVEEHHLLQRREDENTEAFRQVKRRLQQIRDSSADVRYVYTMRMREDGVVVFGVDAEENKIDVSHIGDSYLEHPPQLMEAMRAARGNAQAFTSDKFTTDNWGTWLSAYAPFYTADGRLDGVLGMDMSASTVIAYEREQELTAILMCLVAGLVALAAGMIVAWRIRKPLLVLGAEMNKIQKFDLDSPCHVTSRIVEIERMAREFDTMRSGLQSFRRYVPASLVRQLIELHLEAKLGGREDDLTILFSDIAGFTAVSENLSPAELVELLGEYLEAVTEVLSRHQGTVDKYIGDGIMTFWGAPVPVPDHPYHACAAAIECQTRIRELNAKWVNAGRKVAFRTRIGINTGRVIVGNIGAPERLNYTIIGDAVNVASRIESAGTFYGVDTLVSGTTRDRIGDRIVFRRIDRAAVLGKTLAVDLYTPVGFPDSLPPTELDVVCRTDAAFSLYLDRQFAPAADAFAALLALRPDDGPTRILRDRCLDYVQNPPAKEWTGTFHLHAK